MDGCKFFASQYCYHYEGSGAAELCDAEGGTFCGSETSPSPSLIAESSEDDDASDTSTQVSSGCESCKDGCFFEQTNFCRSLDDDEEENLLMGRTSAEVCQDMGGTFCGDNLLSAPTPPPEGNDCSSCSSGCFFQNGNECVLPDDPDVDAMVEEGQKVELTAAVCHKAGGIFCATD